MSAFWVLAVFVLVATLLPRVGLLAYWTRRTTSARRAAVEDALKHLLEREYRGRSGSFSSLGGVLRLSDAALMALLSRMETQGLVRTEGQSFRLTAEGEHTAMQVVRAHRLWERYLADEARVPLERLHHEAERQEHVLTPEQVDLLDVSLGYPTHDPHGDPIPTRDGSLAPARGTPITAWPIDQSGRIVHLEDEPPLAFAQIVAAGLRIGQVVRVVESSPQCIVLGDGENEYRLAPAVATNVFVTMADFAAAETGVVPLSDIGPDTEVEMLALDPSCQGFSRRRLMDLGFTPGARIGVALSTFTGDPRAYRIRGTTIALRRHQADMILVRPRPSAERGLAKQRTTG